MVGRVWLMVVRMVVVGMGMGMGMRMVIMVVVVVIVIIIIISVVVKMRVVVVRAVVVRAMMRVVVNMVIMRVLFLLPHAVVHLSGPALHDALLAFAAAQIRESIGAHDQKASSDSRPLECFGSRHVSWRSY